jgi:hypothetical protein
VPLQDRPAEIHCIARQEAAVLRTEPLARRKWRAATPSSCGWRSRSGATRSASERGIQSRLARPVHFRGRKRLLHIDAQNIIRGSDLAIIECLRHCKRLAFGSAGNNSSLEALPAGKDISSLEVSNAKQFEYRSINDSSLVASSRPTFRVSKHRTQQFESRNVNVIDIPSLEGFAKLMSNRRSGQR